MCGISGMAFSDGLRPARASTLRAMTDIIRHRGPDGDGFYTAPGVGLGMRRLSIIDLATGQQPIYNEDRTIALVCNGEIYNYLELRALLTQRGHRFRSGSDAEVIVHLYEDRGMNCLDVLRGMFAFALWDNRRQQLMLARDRLGIKPLHWATTADRSLYFGSEIKSILASGAISAAIDLMAFQTLLRYGFVLAPLTMFKGVRQLPPGYYLRYHKGSTEIKRYWELQYPESDAPVPKRKQTDWAEALEAKFDETVQLHLRSDVPVSGWLSPGIDSSAVVAYMRRHSKEDVQTFSMAFEDSACDELSDHPTLDRFPGYEIPNERLLFRSMQLDQFPATLWHEETPDTSGVHVLQWVLARETARRVKVVLTGEGADEVFGGYPWYRFDKLAHPFGWLPTSVRRFMLLGPLLPRWKPWASQVFLADRPIGLASYADLIGASAKCVPHRLLSASLHDALHQELPRPFHIMPDERIRGLHRFHRIQYLEMKTRLLDWILRGLDRISMAHSLEARVPFLDHELIELACRIPPALKMRGLREKYILRRAMATRLPPAIVARKKFGFRAPTGSWLKGRLPDFAQSTLAEDQVRRIGYFNPSAVTDLLTRHRRGEGDFTRPLMLVLGVQLWHALFIDDFRTPALRSEQGNDCGDS